MTAWYSRSVISHLTGRVAFAAAALGVAAALLFSQQGIARADGPYNGYFTVSPNQNNNNNWNNWNNWNNNNGRRYSWQNDNNDWDHNWRNNQGWWGNDGFFHSNQMYRNSPVIYTYNQPRWDPQQRCWVLYNNYNQPTYYTPNAPMYRPSTGVYVVVTVSVNRGYGFNNGWAY